MRCQSALVVAALWLGLAVPALAEDPFTVSGIAVDATAASSTEAQAIAINSGRPKAWNILYRRLTPQANWAKVPALDDLALQRLVRGYTVQDERRSTTRYVAKVTYTFNADAVRRLFRGANIAYVDSAMKPVLVIPMSPNYAAHGAWTDMFANRHDAVPLALPQGDPLDASALNGIHFDTVSWNDLEPVAQRQHAGEAYLAMALPGKGQIVVKLRRVGPGPSPTIADVVVPVPPNASASQAYAAAANAAAGAIVNAWKARSAIDFGLRAKLTADVKIDSPGAWGSLLQRMAAVPVVTDVGIVAMDSGQARVAITYAGTSDQLNNMLAQANVGLSQHDGRWWISDTTP